MEEFGCSEQAAKQWAKATYLELAMLAVSDQPGKPTNIIGRDEVKAAIREALPRVAGKNLACWCKLDEPCHADVLLMLANNQPSEEVR